MRTSTSHLKPKQLPAPTWYLLDASQISLGRLASKIAMILMGKDKPSYSAWHNTGDKVIVINAKDLVVTGNKLVDKVYYRHSGFPGGIKQARLEELVDKTPEQVIVMAVKGMLPKNKLAKTQLDNLYVYSESSHPHSGQQPEVIKLGEKK
ncbi:50S ribosomal protein L13 [Candidatus Saccharibacteria bacterium]|nr:50S ribosomal protein L13 [Candidatus Saccharibacteria bacterium]